MRRENVLESILGVQLEIPLQRTCTPIPTLACADCSFRSTKSGVLVELCMVQGWFSVTTSLSSTSHWPWLATWWSCLQILVCRKNTSSFTLRIFSSNPFVIWSTWWRLADPCGRSLGSCSSGVFQGIVRGQYHHAQTHCPWNSILQDERVVGFFFFLWYWILNSGLLAC
jgi:hypothetical protein